MGAVTWSPGAMAPKVTRAVVGDVLMSTVPVVNVLAGTDAVSVKIAMTPRLMNATSAASTMIVAVSFLAILHSSVAPGHHTSGTGSSCPSSKTGPPAHLLPKVGCLLNALLMLLM